MYTSLSLFLFLSRSQDGVYWPLTPRINFTAWIALTPITYASGRLCILPGSHTAWRDSDYGPVAPPASFGEALPPSAVDAAARVEFELQPGEVPAATVQQSLFSKVIF